VFFSISSLTVNSQTTNAQIESALQAPVSQATKLKQALQSKLDEWHRAGSFPGATLGVVLANGESLSLAVGYSDRDAKTPMKPKDRMLAGSVGKTLAAATALQLVKEGKIGLDDKCVWSQRFLPWIHD